MSIELFRSWVSPEKFSRINHGDFRKYQFTALKVADLVVTIHCALADFSIPSL